MSLTPESQKASSACPAKQLIEEWAPTDRFYLPGSGKRGTWGVWIVEDLGRRCGAKACEQNRTGLLGMQQEQPAILAKHSLVLTEPFGISALYFSVLQFWKTLLVWIEMHLAGLDPAERRLMKLCMLRKFVEKKIKNDSARPSRAKKIPLDLADYAEPFVSAWYPVV